jgi:glycerol-3-phosphate acyltransferase PlsY
MHAAVFLLIPAAYALGGFATGYYARWFTDRRTIPASNKDVPPDELGGWLFVLTFLIDMAKGALAVALGRLLHLPPVWLAATMFAVVAGNIWPAQLNFRGGKGIATMLGALIAFDINILILLLLTSAVLHLTNKNFMLSGLSGIAFVSVFAAMLGHTGAEVIVITVTVAVVLYAHRDEIKAILSEYGYFKRHDGRLR